MQVVTTWSVFEHAFQAGADYQTPHLHADRPSFVVRFAHRETGKEIAVDGFWDGDRTWRVRFAPSAPGLWQWRTSSSDGALDGQSGAFECRPPGEDEIAENPNLRGHVTVDPSGRFFAYADGTPFFLLADTNWAMNASRCGISQDRDGPFHTWLADRRAKGFTAIMTELFEIDQANEGGYPFPNNSQPPGTGDYSQLNAEHFQWLDKRIVALWENGWVICTVPTWIGKHVGMSRSDAIALSRYLMARYGAYNLIWGLSGEYQYAYTHLQMPWTKGDWRALGQAVSARNVYGHPISLHPSSRQDPDDPEEWPEEAHEASSGGEFHDEPWLDHNWLQTGHALALLCQVPKRVAENYGRAPSKPVLHAEGYYERQRSDGASSRMIRWQAWTAYLNGAAGHAYGANGVWQFYDSTARPDAQPWHGQPWPEALRFEGSAQLKHLADFFASIPWHRLEPHREWLRIRGVPVHAESLTDPHCAAIADELCVIYVPAGNSGKRIEIMNLGGRRYQAQWFDPRTGEYSAATEEPIQGSGPDGRWRAPSVFRHRDWVLLLRALG